MVRDRSFVLFAAAWVVGLSLSARADLDGARTRLSLENQSFVSPDYQATPHNNYEYIGAGVQTEGLGPNNKFQDLESGLQMSLDGQFAPGATVMSYLNIRQMYYQQGAISVGRRLENWSLLDEAWNLGIYQPQFRWNALMPESQGLTGIFAHLHGQSEVFPWGVVLMGTPIFIPDQGPGYNIKKGQFEAVNPWFHPPQANADFQSTGVTDSLNYDVQSPDAGKMVFNSGYAARLYAGDVEHGLYFQAGFAYKPMNTLSLGLEAKINPFESIDVQVDPALQYHRVESADLQYTWDSFEMGVGALHEKPEDPKFDSEWTYQTYGESTLVSPFIGARLGPVHVRAMTLSVVGPDEEAVGPEVSQFSSVLAHRYPFRDAAALDVSTRFYWHAHEGITVGTRYMQGSRDEFELVTGHLRYQMDAAWSFAGQLALVRAQADPTHQVLYSSYDDNDYVQAGVLYVF